MRWEGEENEGEGDRVIDTGKKFLCTLSVAKLGLNTEDQGSTLWMLAISAVYNFDRSYNALRFGQTGV